MDNQEELAQIKKLEAQLADLKARLPAHSVPPSMMIELDELEDELAALYSRQPKQESTE